MVVGAEEAEHRVEEPRALQALKYRVRAIPRSETSNAEPVVPPLEHAQNVARLRDLEVREGIQER